MEQPPTAYALFEVAADDASRSIIALRAARMAYEMRVDETLRPIDSSQLLIRVESREPVLVVDNDGELARRASIVLIAAGVTHRLVGDGVRRSDARRPR
jgi:hypothetical protein